MIKRLVVALAALLALAGGAAANHGTDDVQAKDVIWTKTVPVSQNVTTVQAKLDPSSCNGQFGRWQNTSAPWGLYRCDAASVPRNTCLVGTPPYRFFINETNLYWLVFRASDTTCSGAHVALPPRSGGTVTGFDLTWYNFGAAMRTSWQG